jgi:hypothetical protein
MTPVAGQYWIKNSCPWPTVVEVLEVSPTELLLRTGARSKKRVGIQLFLDQGFFLHDINSSIDRGGESCED